MTLKEEDGIMISQLISRLEAIESRLSQMETDKSRLLDERRVPAKIGQLGGKTISNSALGGVEKRVEVPFCDLCGRRVEEEDSAVCGCGKKVCVDSCLVNLSSEFLCVECLKERLPLDKKEYKVLVGVANELGRGAISKITKMGRDDVRSAIFELTGLGLIRKRGVSVFTKLEVTDLGLEAIGAFENLFNDVDVLQFFADLRKHLAERM